MRSLARCTSNLLHAATPQDIAWIYDRAWELGLKGIIIYRYGSKAAQVIEFDTGERTNTSTGRRATRESAGSKAESTPYGECESAMKMGVRERREGGSIPGKIKERTIFSGFSPSSTSPAVSLPSISRSPGLLPKYA